MLTNGSGLGVDGAPGAPGVDNAPSPAVVASTVRDERPADPGPLLPPEATDATVGWSPTAWKRS